VNPYTGKEGTKNVYPTNTYVPVAEPARKAEPAPPARTSNPSPSGTVPSSSSSSLKREVLIGRVVNVSDGDTFTLLDEDNRQTKIRLYGIDCPEKGQPFGEKARLYAASLIAGKTVRVKVIDTDRYGRKVGFVLYGDGQLNEDLLMEGLAWNYVAYNKILSVLFKNHEDEARRSLKNIWSTPDPVAPWDYRNGTRPVSAKSNSSPNQSETTVKKAEPKERAANNTAVKKQPAKKAVANTIAITQPAANITAKTQPAKRSETRTEAIVLICHGKSAYAYHTHYCSGLSRCRAGVSNVTKSEAERRGYRPCKICY
jgi:endonuclease YncB( thermonuclease family)